MILDEENRLGASFAIPALIALAQIRKERRRALSSMVKAIQRSESATRVVVERLVEAGLSAVGARERYARGRGGLGANQRAA